MRQEVQAYLTRLVEASNQGSEMSASQIASDLERLAMTPDERAEFDAMLVANYREDNVMKPDWEVRAELLRLIQGPGEEQQRQVEQWLQRRNEIRDV